MTESQAIDHEAAGLNSIKEAAAMATPTKDPHKDQDPQPESIDPPKDVPPVELTGDPVQPPNV